MILGAICDFHVECGNWVYIAHAFKFLVDFLYKLWSWSVFISFYT